MKRTTLLMGALLIVISGTFANRVSANGIVDNAKIINRAIVIERQITADKTIIQKVDDKNIIIDGIIAKAITTIDVIDNLIIG
jgi:hypothetical protein